MVTNRLLIELGVEELPVSYIKPALRGFATSLKNCLKEERLLDDEPIISTMATPRRLTVFIEGFASKQTAETKDIFGPPLKAAKNKDGNWSKASLGFAKKNNVAVESITTQTDAKGIEKLYIQQTLPEHTATEVLAQHLPQLIQAIKTPKTMRFVPFKPLRFARPLCWIVALLNEEIIPFEMDGLRSDRVTYGHRFAVHNEALELATADIVTYENKLSQLRVMADPNKRRKVIEVLLKDEAQKICTNPNWEQLLDQDLLEIVTYCVEWPDIVMGEFNAEFLKIPHIVPITSMKHHQKYFPVIDEKRGLLPFFLSITNGVGNKEAIATGNERVISARLADAVFFWKEDTKVALSKRYNDLKAMMYQKDIGSYWDKTESTRALAQSLCQNARLDPQRAEFVDRAIMLSKIDLITQMVYEFPELQGEMGGEYAQLSQEEPQVINALQQQYSLEAVEEDVANMLIAADRLDTLQQAFRIGTKVSGSSDPYGLRRAALTLIQVLHHTKWFLPIEGENLVPFVMERLKGYAQDQLNIRYDVVEAVLKTVGNEINVADVLKRMKTIQEAIDSNISFGDLLLLCGRIVNILKQANDKHGWNGQVTFNANLSKQVVETAVDQAFQNISTEEIIYKDLFEGLTQLKTPLDDFFEQVMVLCDDEKQRNNHLALLQQIANIVQPIADFSMITKNNSSKVCSVN